MSDRLTQEEMKNKFIDVKPLPPSQFEIDYNKGTFNPQELLEKEEQNRLTYDEKITLNNRRAVLTQCKTIALDMRNLNPLTNTNTMTKEEYVSLCVEINSIRTTWTAEDREKKFNEICNKTIFGEKAQYWNYPVYDV
jgi:hypothetical protein